ncbi:MAG: rhomboid family intramembrane serine protease [Bacteroidota bacterium]
MGGNMAALYLVGGDLEKAYVRHYGPYKGRFFYLLLYLEASLPSLIVNARSFSRGASGGTHGLMAAYALMYPFKKIAYIPNCIFQPLYVFITTYVIAERLLGMYETKSIMDMCQGGHGAHIAGALSGLVITLIFDPSIVKRLYNYLGKSTVEGQELK